MWSFISVFCSGYAAEVAVAAAFVDRLTMPLIIAVPVEPSEAGGPSNLAELSQPAWTRTQASGLPSSPIRMACHWSSMN